jgi:hypothetical protein
MNDSRSFNLWAFHFLFDLLFLIKLNQSDECSFCSSLGVLIEKKKKNINRNSRNSGFLDKGGSSCKIVNDIIDSSQHLFLLISFPFLLMHPPEI